MDQNLGGTIRKVENIWLQKLTANCALRFSKTHLPSHDAAHHQRVWAFAKDLINVLNTEGITISETEIEQLIIAVFFHDQGMSQSFSPEHGKISSQLCSSFFKENQLPPPPDFYLVLASIEMHDKKDYCWTNNEPGTYNLHQLLNISDDLDAFSVIGAYRYIEIYLLRHYAIADLPKAVMENLTQRYNHFLSVFNSNSTFSINQKTRYMAAMQFFTDLATQLNSKTYIAGTYTGPLGVVNLINDKILRQQWSIPEICSFIETSRSDSYIEDFFKLLQTEYSISSDIKI